MQGTNIKPLLLLVIVCIISAVGLTFTYRSTEPKIEKNKEKEKNASMQEVLKEAEEFREISPGKQWIGYKKNEKVGRIALISVKGYGGPITLMAGVDDKERIITIKVLGHTETPGLGSKITDPDFIEQFRGRSLDEMILKKDDPASGKIEAVTSATISSRAIVKAVREALELKNNFDTATADRK